MQKRIPAIALAAALALPVAALAEEEESASPFSANIGLVSDYAYRGISQTDEKPAVQGGFDFKHSSGLYLGTWATNVSWLRDAESNKQSGNSLEIDFYGGFSKSFGDFGFDVGLLYYRYPGSYGSTWQSETGLEKPHTLEGYAAVSWKFLTFKYSYSFTDLFGAEDSKGSDYLDLSVNYEVIKNLTLNAHVGKQRVYGPGKGYKDWKLGATYNYAGFDFGLHYVDTNIDSDDDPDSNADARVIFSITKSF